MPEVGDIIYSKRYECRLIYNKCSDCGKGRWVRIKDGKPSRTICASCNIHNRNLRINPLLIGESHPNWKGGRIITIEGYVTVFLNSDSPFFPMINTVLSYGSGYVLEHRLIMARHLGRCLDVKEVVHHINGTKTDNRLENLVITTQSEHMRSHRINKIVRAGGSIPGIKIIPNTTIRTNVR
jgi:hypothetical protein